MFQKDRKSRRKVQTIDSDEPVAALMRVTVRCAGESDVFPPIITLVRNRLLDVALPSSNTLPPIVSLSVPLSSPFAVRLMVSDSTVTDTLVPDCPIDRRVDVVVFVSEMPPPLSDVNVRSCFISPVAFECSNVLDSIILIVGEVSSALVVSAYWIVEHGSTLHPHVGYEVRA